MRSLFLLACIVSLLACGIASALRRNRPRDWREGWCLPIECWAPDDQEGPCDECPGRRCVRRHDGRSA